MDSAVIPLGKHNNLSLVQTVDFFYPLLDDPYVMGRIALANVVSDVFAVGVTQIDRVSLILSASTEFNEKETDVMVSRITSGFMVIYYQSIHIRVHINCQSFIYIYCAIQDGVRDVNKHIQIQVNNVAVNPFCIIGGVATSICTPDEIIQ